MILVEGIAEQFILPALSKAQGIDLDRMGITVCSVNGTDFAPYRGLLSDRGFNIPCAVVTDGDPIERNGAVTYWGLERAVRLLPVGQLQSRIRGYIENQELDKANQSLAQNGIFVGTETLETDCLPTLASPMIRTFAQLGLSDRQKQKLEEWVTAGQEGDQKAADSLLRTIEGIGKGRFAQRLAANISNEKGPSYLLAAVRWIVKQVS